MPTDSDSIDWSPTTAQKVGAGVGLVIGLLSLAQDDLPAWVRVAFPVAYAVACAVIPRMRGVVRYRRTRQFAAHQVAMAVIAAGWLAADSVPSATFNGAWFVSAGLWWLLERADS
ncbi:hypothetical protein [Actinospongicola halichondriae]|uniref:hypothetical protein n=1 Tax=Actinospongicola halichondriae TaxID=3236844 RepID=UPI003D37579D